MTNKLVIREHQIIMTVGDDYPISRKVLAGLYLLARKFGNGNNPTYIECFFHKNRIKTRFVWNKIPSHFSSKDKMLDIQRACGRKPSIKSFWFNEKRGKFVIHIDFTTCEDLTINDIYFVETEEHFAELRNYFIKSN